MNTSFTAVGLGLTASAFGFVALGPLGVVLAGVLLTVVGLAVTACPNCGVINSESYDTCHNCGSDLPD